MTSFEDLLNKGFIVKLPTEMHSSKGGRTIIVTGLLRSGTSLVASMLQQMGIFIGTEINDSVYEDEEIARALASSRTAALTQIIRERDERYGTWGFKLPMLCHYLDPGQIALFNDPHLIVTFRDLVAISVRTSLSEYQEPMHAMQQAMDSLASMLTFIGGLHCPTLLLSYEKSMMLPQYFVDAVMRFCEVPQDAALRERLLAVIEPNRPSYIAVARSRYEGTIDGIIDCRLYGWCRLTHSTDPVMLDVFVNERKVLRLVANVFRQDLLDAGFGHGRHGFFIPFEELGAQLDALIRIEVVGRGFELGNSGTSLQEFSRLGR